MVLESCYSYRELEGRTRLWYALILLVLCVVGALGYTAYQTYVLVPQIERNLNARLDAVGTRLAERDDQVKAVLKSVSDLVEATSMDNYAAVQTTTVILRDIAEITRQVREGLLPNVNGLIGDMRDLVTGLRADVDRLTGSADATLKPLARALDNAASLLKTLDEQVQVGAPEARETIVKVNKTLDDVDRLLADPNIAATLAHVEAGTESLASSAESVNQALLPLRKKVSMIKAVFKFVLSRFTYGFSK